MAGQCTATGAGARAMGPTPGPGGFVGVFAGYLLVLHREKRKFPWSKVLPYILALLVILAIAGWVLVVKYHFHLVKHWPYFMK